MVPRDADPKGAWVGQTVARKVVLVQTEQGIAARIAKGCVTVIVLVPTAATENAISPVPGANVL